MSDNESAKIDACLGKDNIYMS